MRFAERLDQVSSSQTQEVLATVQGLREEGVDIIDLGAGEPDFDTPDHIARAAVTAIREGNTKYTPGAGIGRLREAVAQHYTNRTGVDFERNQVVVTSGGKQGLFNAALALFGTGDEVVTHVPGWPSIGEQIKLAGAELVQVRTHLDNSFAIRAADVLERISPRTRGVVINSPVNPTGALMSEVELGLLVTEITGRDIWLVLDLCYEQLIYDSSPHNLIGVAASKMPDRTVVVGSASKSYAMTGWRCGWVVAPKRVASACNLIQSHSTSHPTSISQYAALAALSGPQECVEKMRNEYRRRRDFMIDRMSKDVRFRTAQPNGAFYLFPDVSDCLDPEGPRTSIEFVKHLLINGHVAVTAGEAFDAPGYIRLSYAASLEKLEEAWERIQGCLE
ncbi:MAG: L-aspartate aminotransferase [Acidobacteria bacterium]|nr:L-aspartate aminotransferase [Acidobacteriota bacterium]|tara:strand:- start:2665 stop:3837 length:1173 start_codon:yes stop_codon:yes gene_type:complete